MATNAKSIIPAVATHPGSVLKRELKARGIKQKDFAEAIGMPASNLSALIKGNRNITESIAIKLEEALGIPYQNCSRYAAPFRSSRHSLPASAGAS